MDLLDPAYAPLNWQIGFLEVPFSLAVEAEVARYKSWDDCSVTHKEIQVRLPGGWGNLEPLTGPPSKELWLETRSPWTAVFHDWFQGGDLIAPISKLCEQLGCRGVAIMCHPEIPRRKVANEWSGVYGGLRFVLLKPDAPDPLRFERHILLFNDSGKWKFFAKGVVQSFEETGRYTSLRLRNRFSLQMLRNYCDAFNIRAFESDFYGPAGALIEYRKGRTWSRSLLEAQQKLGVDNRKPLRF